MSEDGILTVRISVVAGVSRDGEFRSLGFDHHSLRFSGDLEPAPEGLLDQMIEKAVSDAERKDTEIGLHLQG